MKWYCLHTAPKQENKVAQLLKRELGLEVFAPRIRFRRMRSGQPIWAIEALFPGYLFARFKYFERRRQINALPGVTSIVHFGEQVAPIDDAVMTDLRAIMGDNETVEVTADPQPGSEVVITGGSLRGLRVLVTRVMPARQRITVLLELLGGEREVEIEWRRVVRVDPRQSV
jgi:transcriptional antiterminator RfaH